MEERRREAGLRVTRCLPCSFSQRAVNAGESQILQRGLATRRLRHDMVNMEGGRLAEL